MKRFVSYWAISSGLVGLGVKVNRTSNALALDLTWFSALETASIAFQLRSLNS